MVFVKQRICYRRERIRLFVVVVVDTRLEAVADNTKRRSLLIGVVVVARTHCCFACAEASVGNSRGVVVVVAFAAAAGDILVAFVKIALICAYRRRSNRLRFRSLEQLVFANADLQ